MATREPHDVTAICHAVQEGQPGAEQKLFDLVYSELRRMAHYRLLREGHSGTLQTTALVHEAYLRLFQGSEVNWENRRHFFGAAANAMRRILIDRARRRKAEKRGGDQVTITLGDNVPDAEPSLDLIALDEALNRLSRELPRHAEVVCYRFFLGLTVKETAELLDVSPRTVNSHWELARSWLRREINGPSAGPP
jgi:RNA polymerase sigma factor (TIGR02999 family)